MIGIQIVCNSRPQLECLKNDDDAEDVLGALDEAIKLKWSSENRLLFQLAALPHHGKNSHQIFFLSFSKICYNG